MVWNLKNVEGKIHPFVDNTYFVHHILICILYTDIFIYIFYINFAHLWNTFVWNQRFLCKKFSGNICKWICNQVGPNPAQIPVVWHITDALLWSRLVSRSCTDATAPCNVSWPTLSNSRVFGYLGDVVVLLFCFSCLSWQSTHETMDRVQHNLSCDLQPQLHTSPPSAAPAVNLPEQTDRMT